MTNVLTGLIPTLFEALNRVSREQCGFVSAVTRDTSAERAAINQVIRSPIGDSGPLEDITPGATPAASGGTTVGYADVSITKSKAAPILWTGEEEKAIGTTGQYNAVLADQFAEGMRKLVNAVELDLGVCVKQNASRAYGTAGTAPFGTVADLSDFAGVLKILEDNGAPTTDLQMVLGSSAVANLRGKQTMLAKVNEAGSSDMLRNGMTDRVMNFALRNSAGVQLHTKGTGASYLINNGAGEGIGDNALALDTGSGTILAGDIVTIGSDTNKYVANAALAASSLTIGKPGLLVAAADNAALTVGANYTPNAAFARTAIILVARPPAVPTGGDNADDLMTLTDPMTGLVFEVRVYRQYRQVKFEICLAWGVAGVKSEHVSILLG